MKPFYQVASLIIDNEFKQNDFKHNRKDWYRREPGDPVLFSYTSVHHGDGTYHAEVNIYRRNLQQCPSEKVA